MKFTMPREIAQVAPGKPLAVPGGDPMKARVTGTGQG
jgi:hypothetical protein